MARKVTVSQAMDALEVIQSEAKDSQKPAIEVLEGFLYNRHDYARKLAETELRAIYAESKYLKLKESIK